MSQTDTARDAAQSMQQKTQEGIAAGMLPAPEEGPKRRSTDKYSGVKKAAMLMVLLGEEISAILMRHLCDEEVQQISKEIARTINISAQNAEDILEEFYQMTVARNYVVQGGMDYAKRLLEQTYGRDTAQRILDRLIQAISKDGANFDVLQKADPQQLAKFIQTEHPQTIALILSHLNATQAAALLMSLPQDLHAEVATRMASLDQISPEVVSRIAAIIGQKLQELGEYSRESYGGVQAVAELFNRLDAGTAQGILQRIEEDDETLGKSIRHLMFVFEDILKLDANALREILSRVDRKLLTVALKGTSEPLRQHFVKVMSQRAAEMLREDMDALGPVKIREVDDAQQQIISVIRQLETEGVISLGGGGGDEYVS